MHDIIDPTANSAAGVRSGNRNIRTGAPPRTARRILRPGLHIGQLTTLARIPAARAGQHDKWRCQCACGRETIVRSSNLVSGKTTSCGCARKNKKAAAPKQETRGRKPKAPYRNIGQRWTLPTHAAAARLAALWDCDVTQATEIALQYLATMAESRAAAPRWLLDAPAVLGLAHAPAADPRQEPRT